MRRVKEDNFEEWGATFLRVSIIHEKNIEVN